MDTSLLVAPGVRRLTVNLDQDDVTLFEDLWPVPEGVALHAYLVQGDRTVVIDPWDAGGYGPEEVEADLADLGLTWKSITAVAFTKPPTADLMARLQTFHPGVEFWGGPTPGTRHDLGGGMILEQSGGFWSVSGLLFTGDAFAGLGWVEDELWTEDLNEGEARYFEDEALRWFVGRPLVPSELPVGTSIAPAHGCLWKSSIQALERARMFASWATDGGVDEVTVVWPVGDDGGADALVGGALDADAGLNLFRMPGDDTMALKAAARRCGLVVLAEGLDDEFLSGLEKPLWRPAPSLSPDDLRAGLVERWNASS